MNLNDLLKKRRSYQLLEKIEVTNEMIYELAEAARVAPSCSNKQPWKYVIVKDEDILEEFSEVYSEGNEWAEEASVVIAVLSNSNDDCVMGKKEYAFFDTGIATGFLMLKATELNLVAHPIAGFNARKVKKLLDIPGEMNLLTLIIIGKHANLKNYIKYNRIELEENRPIRHDKNKFIFLNKFNNSFEQ